MAMTAPVAPARRRAAQAQAAPLATDAPQQKTQAAASETTGVPAQVQTGQAALPSAQVWTNPYPTQYTAVPIASPPANPDLTPQDVAAQISEYSDWDKYLSSLGLTAANMSASTTTKVADIERALAERLDQNNWDTAGRGLAQSSIRDVNAANSATDAASAKGGAISSLVNQENFGAGEANKWGGVGGAKQAIDAKYGDIAAGHRAERAAAAAAAAPPPTPPAPPAPPAPNPFNPAPGTVGPMQGTQYGTQPNGTYVTDPSTQGMGSGQSNSGGKANVYMQDTGLRKGLRYIITDGHRKYESKPGAGDWGKGGIIKIGG